MISLNPRQIDLLARADFRADLLAGSIQQFNSLSADDQAQALAALNVLYRAGEPAVTDQVYDTLLDVLKSNAPDHPYLNNVEPELDGVFSEKTVTLSQRMLSTDKAYSIEEIQGWARRVIQAGNEIGLHESTIKVRATPKLDGFAALDDGEMLCTRGDGYRGADISHVFDRGLSIVGGVRGQGPGEIVIEQGYFEEHLVNDYDNTRNFQSAIIKEGGLDEKVQAAINNAVAVFYPFSQLPEWTGTLHELLDNFDDIIETMWGAVGFDVDGVVIEAPELREAMGHTLHHHRNTIAFKRNDAPVYVPVRDITFQTGKTGKVTPVAELEPTRISRAVISRATLHNVGWAESREVGAGAVVGVVRSGLVIPKVVDVQRPAPLTLPTCCESCGEPLERIDDNLYCTNKSGCPAQNSARLEYFFKTLGRCDGFGAKTIAKLFDAGIKTVSQIYKLSRMDYARLGFGEKTTDNLIYELTRSRHAAVEDWRFLAAFSINQIGRGGCERILAHHSLNDVFTLTVDDVIQIDGFAKKTASMFVDSLAAIREEVETVMALGFNIVSTKSNVTTESPITGKTIVFTGSMMQGSRDEMAKQAKQLGAKVAGSVTGKTDYLVIGEKVGATKLNAAEKNGTTVLTEQQYLDLIA